jgi:hypothetical protein
MHGGASDRRSGPFRTFAPFEGSDDANGKQTAAVTTPEVGALDLTPSCTLRGSVSSW